MKAFTVLVNGRKVADIGIGAKGVLTCIVHCATGFPPDVENGFFRFLVAIMRPRIVL